MRAQGYGQFCPVAKASEVLTERWTPLVVRELLAGSHRFNELRRGVPLMSPTLLSERLQSLERAGVVRRIRKGTQRYWEYHLTEAGEQLGPLIGLMAAWGTNWAMGRITRRDLDPSLIMWAVLRKLRGQRHLFPEGRVVVMFTFPDADKGMRYWWLVLRRPEAEICWSDPGFGIDLELRTGLRTMVAVLLGEVTFDQARRDGSLAVEGAIRLRRLLGGCLAPESEAAPDHVPH